MNKKIVIIIGVLVVVAAVLVGILVDSRTTTTKEFSDEMTEGFENFQEKVDAATPIPLY